MPQDSVSQQQGNREVRGSTERLAGWLAVRRRSIARLVLDFVAGVLVGLLVWIASVEPLALLLILVSVALAVAAIWASENLD